MFLTCDHHSIEVQSQPYHGDLSARVPSPSLAVSLVFETLTAFFTASTMTTSSAIQTTFLRSPLFAVVGASKDQNKFGTKVFFF